MRILRLFWLRIERTQTMQWISKSCTIKSRRFSNWIDHLVEIVRDQCLTIDTNFEWNEIISVFQPWRTTLNWHVFSPVFEYVLDQCEKKNFRCFRFYAQLEGSFKTNLSVSKYWIWLTYLQQQNNIGVTSIWKQIWKFNKTNVTWT